MGTWNVAPTRPMPSATAVPPGRRHATACCSVSARPTASIAQSTPSGTSPRTVSTMSSRPARTTVVAPRMRARSSFASSTSTTMIGSAPASRAPITADRPTPPAPMTSSARPAHSPTTLSTAPTPVITAQPVMAAIGEGIASGTLTTDFSETTARSAKHDTPIRWWTSRPSRRSRVVPSSGRPPVVACTRPSTHITGCPARQWRQRPQRGRQSSATRSPGRTLSTPAPTASTTPHPSWPTTTGSGTRRSPVM